MKIDAQIAPVQHDNLHSVEPRDQTSWQLAWRRELERAQRSQAQHGQAPRPTTHGDRRPQHGGDALLMQSTTALAIEDWGGSTPELKPDGQIRVASADSLPSLVHENGAGSVLSLPEAPLEPSLPSVVTSAYAFVTNELTSRGPQPTPAAALDALIARMEQLAWMPNAGHVSLQGNRVTVALRDGRLSEQEVRDLMWRVRKEVHSWGFELAALVVNGRMVQPAGE